MAHTARLLHRVSGFALALAGVTLFSTFSYAGFQFTPLPHPAAPGAAASTSPAAPASALPDSGSMLPDMPPVGAAPQPPVDSAALSSSATAAPSAASTARAPAAMMTASPADPIPTVPAHKVAATPVVDGPFSTGDTVSAAMQPASSSQSSTYATVKGFGKDIPLALAMRQIVPAKYAYQFDSSVKPGARVSWQGGKPWNDVLADAVAPLGLGVDVSGMTVRVMSKDQIQSAGVVGAYHDNNGQGPVMDPRTGMATQPVREVYIHRNADAADIQERVPGHPENTASATPADKDNASESSPSFWQRIGVAGLFDSSKSDDDNNGDKGTITTGNQAAATQTVGDMTAPAPIAANANASANAPIPNGPGDVGPPMVLTESLKAPQGDSVPMMGSPSSPAATVASSASAAGALDQFGQHDFQAQKGDSLKTTLQNWSRMAGVQVYWSAPGDYKLPENIQLTGTYTDAVTKALNAYGDSGDRPLGQLHPNLPNGPSVLVIAPAPANG